MRVNKFRGKRSDGRWVYGSLISGITDKSVEVSFIAPGLPCVAEAYDIWGAKMYRVDPKSVGQFTGLHDKHGHEIYEDDIIRSTRNGFGGVVKWHKRGYFYIREDIFEDDPDYNGDYANLGYMLENHPYFEVVGNISDNAPERLKGGENERTRN